MKLTDAILCSTTTIRPIIGHTLTIASTASPVLTIIGPMRWLIRSITPREWYGNDFNHSEMTETDKAAKFEKEKGSSKEGKKQNSSQRRILKCENLNVLKKINRDNAFGGETGREREKEKGAREFNRVRDI
ncbi:hypothetical protein niasHT_027527 [Heterodera trifolii]|uniref:Uncharacterized protein n=1 Tax=Heterodera trifolii TaxID=157864 RepID=A0ABD2K524_9BILA